MDTEEETIIDLSNYSISEACYWLLQSLYSNQFMHLAYTIPFCGYILSWPRAVPLQTILIMQSPYPNNIFPPIAAAMSYSSELCKKNMKGLEIPPTVQVLANDLYINGGMEREDSISILKNGWALVDKGILMVNEAVFHTYEREQSYIEAAKQCAVIIRLLQETEKHGKRTVNIYAFGEVGEKMGSNLCSWYKSSIVTLTKRKVTHPAGVARRYTDLNDPKCHMGTPSFSKSLVKCFRNHVAFMHTMAKKSDTDIRYQRQQDVLKGIHDHFPTIGTSFKTYHELNIRAMDLQSGTSEHKEIVRKLDSAADDLITRFRIAGSLTNNLQAYGGTVSNSISKTAPSLRNQAPSNSLLSRHVGQEPTVMSQISSTTNLKIKPAKPKRASTPADASSFTEVASPPSVTSLNTESSGLKIKPAKTRNISLSNTPVKETPEKQSSTQTDSAQTTVDSHKDAKLESENNDTLSPLVQRFQRKMRTAQPKSSSSTSSKMADDPFTDKKLTKEQIHQLSCVEQVVISQKGQLDESEDSDDVLYIESIQNDIKAKTIYNGIVERLVASINKDLEKDPKFNFIDWALDSSNPSATFETCKEEFEF